MDFFGPQATDFANVRALNHAFLLRLREPRQGRLLRQRLPPDVAVLIEGLTNLQIERLAATPFLLASLRERDEASWRSLESDGPNLDLFSAGHSHSDELLTTVVSFLWQLASRNPYAARLISGASLGWCERLAGCTLLNVLRTAADCDDLLRPRFAKNVEFWRKLLGPGLSSDSAVRQSAHVTCLQWLLTDEPAAHYQRLRSAACDNPVPTRRVAEKPRNG
jgi:hypothetical protein